MVILRSAPLPVQPPSFCAEVAPADILLPCPDCGKRLWCHHDFIDGEDTYYCPDCTRYELASA